jgi:hypothetical protein
MPFKSEAQRRWMYATDPEMAKRWESETPTSNKLPKHKSKGVKVSATKQAAKTKKRITTESLRVRPVSARSAERNVLEFVRNERPCRVDRDKGIIHDCKIVGLVSKNGGRYTRQALESALNLYEGAKCNINHPSRERPGADRDAYDRLGIFRGVYQGNDGLYADLYFLKSHPFSDRAAEAAESEDRSGVFGFSHNARTVQRVDDHGEVVHESITRVRSVDLVADSATTNSIFESEDQTMIGDLTSDMSGPAAGDLGGPAEAHETSTADPVDVAIDALLVRDLPKIKSAAKGERNALLGELKNAINALLDALSEVEEEEVSPGGGEEAGTEETTEEPTEEPTEETTTESDRSSVNGRKSKSSRPAYEAALDVLESAGVQPTAQRIRWLLSVPDAERKPLADSWPKIGAGSSVSKPRSSSVLESQRDRQAKPTDFTKESLHDDAQLLMAGPRNY